ncbi:MAG: hypothetical protein DRP56_03970 [Planctomycetota bacterium]|nr:MAG: hypothetical protein DRP56_03970 [Planctomycetota bacterium]
MRKQIEDLKKCVKTSCQSGNYDCNPYMHGMANGMILALAILEGKEPAYLDAPAKWLDADENIKAAAPELSEGHKMNVIEAEAAVNLWKLHKHGTSMLPVIEGMITYLQSIAKRSHKARLTDEKGQARCQANTTR